MHEPGAKPPSTGRRRFLQGMSLAGAAVMAPAGPLRAQGPEPAPGPAAGAAPPPDLATETLPPPADPVTQTSRAATSWSMCCKHARHRVSGDELRLELSRPARSGHQLWQATSSPEMLTCPHEEIAVAMAHGYAKIEGKPIGDGLPRRGRPAARRHGDVQRLVRPRARVCRWAATSSRPTSAGSSIAEWVHSAVDIAAGVRDSPSGTTSRPRCSISPNRRCAPTRSPPRRRWARCSCRSTRNCRKTRFRKATGCTSRNVPNVIPPQAIDGALAEAAKMLVEAQAPLIVGRPHGAHAGRARAAGRTRGTAAMRRCSIAWAAHEFSRPATRSTSSFRRNVVVGQADVILAIEINDHWAALNAFQRPHRAHLAAALQADHENHHARRARPVSEGQLPGFRPLRRQSISAIAGDGEASLPALTEAVRRLVDAGRKSAFEARGKQLRGGALDHASSRPSPTPRSAGTRARSRTARLCAEVYAQIQRRGLVAGRQRASATPGRTAVGIRQAASAGSALRRCRHRLQRPGFARRRARQQAPRAPDASRFSGDGDLHVRPEHAVDGGASPHPDPLHRCTTTAPTIRNTCTCRRWRTVTCAASPMRTSARP